MLPGMFIGAGIGAARRVIPELRSGTQNDGGSSQSVSVIGNKPSGVEVGDTLILIVMNDAASGIGVQFADDVTDWTFLGVSTGGAGPSVHIGVYAKIADGTEPSTVTVTASDSANWNAYYLRISGAHETNPVTQISFGIEASDVSSHTIEGVTTTVDNSLIIYSLAFDGGDGFPFSVAGSDFIEIDDFQTSTATDELSGCFGARELPIAGASGTATVTSSVSDGSAYVQIAIAPV